ncbi:MAG: hypothetical protein VXW28_03615, partial [Candidatus Thermoplasmatota archaeon]|nr:hypothetical protein [Candidatus Thermoplasmatota archaeon]
RYPGVPSHMVLDKDSGILYISDTGANRVLWVNTDDQSTSSTDIYNQPSRMEPLAQYLRVDGVEWGVLDTGLNRPSGIALDGSSLFVSEYGSSEITAYQLDANGRSATVTDVIQTSAQKIMGIEIGPDNQLYYVDNGRDQVVRIDPYYDLDEDGIMDEDDNCISTPNTDQANYDGDSFGDVCDDDDDNDTVLDEVDSCQFGQQGWTSVLALDYDSDGCADANEDNDDDNDGIIDVNDICPVGEKDWWSRASNDYDGDGCRDESEDLDDDNDGICDVSNSDEKCQVSTMSYDMCPASSLDFTSNLQTDNDGDGCEDSSEDTDDDNDGYADEADDCPLESGSSFNDLVGCLDTDYDGYTDSQDAFPLDTSQWADTDNDGYGDEVRGTDGDYCPNIAGTSTKDRIGCIDSDGDGWSNPDSMWNVNLGADAFPDDVTQHFDGDQDGYGDNAEGNQPDACPSVFGTSNMDLFGCRDSDGDGWSDAADSFKNDATQWSDQDGDGYGDEIGGNLPDACPTEFGNSTITRYGCVDSDGDGLDDELDAFPLDASETIDTDGDGVGDNIDAYPQDPAKSVLETEDESSTNIVNIAIIAGVILTLVVVFVLFATRKKQPEADLPVMGMDASQAMFNPQPLPLQQPVVTPAPQAVAPQGPPLPAEGLPPGWTMEQWAWYGEDYLRNQ